MGGRGIVIGTAGHVDHGKTTLVRVLTGIDTDRLPEEKARGISIELGFAWLDRPSSGEVPDRVAFVDVPGHERFVRQMIAGAAGIDAVLLVVAADEGVMPQTREHLTICRLLGVAVGAVVVTKVDRVEAEWLALVIDDVRALVRGTFLEGRPIVPFGAGDAVARAAVLALVDALVAELALAADGARLDRPAVLPFDRAFLVQGFGTVVTGTLHAGVLRLGDEVVIHPGAHAARVRGLEVHGRPVEVATAGHRVAVNVPQVSADARAGTLVGPLGPRPTSMIDATFIAAPGLPEPVPDGARGLVHLGTERVEATLALLGPAGANGAPAQLRLARPLVFTAGAPYVLRGFRAWPGRPELGLTLGGGRALAPSARRHKRAAATADLTSSLAAGRPEAIVSWIAAHGEVGVEADALTAALPWSASALAELVSLAHARDELVRLPPATWVASSALGPLERALTAIVDVLHAADPSRAGLSDAELASRVRPEGRPELVAAVVARLVARGALERVGARAGGLGLVARRGYRPPAAADPAVLDRLVATFEAAGFAPPAPRDLVGPHGAPAGPLVEALVKAGRLVRVSADLVFAASTLAELERRTRRWFETHAWLEAQDLKEIVQASRKFAIPLGEWLDKARITVRVGDRRRLRA